ncbi:MAG: phospholipase D-like domain-containing protein [Pseudomonadota bacterium]
MMIRLRAWVFIARAILFPVFLASSVLAQQPAVLPVELALSVPFQTETYLQVQGVRSTQQVWLNMINGAQSTIDLEQFYITSEEGKTASPVQKLAQDQVLKDKIGLKPVLDAIRLKAAAGIPVRFLIDLTFYKKFYRDEADELSTHENIQVRTIDFKPGVQHAKFFVVDGKNAFVGSANFDWLALTHIHEVGIRVSDSVLGGQLEKVFEKDWAAGVSLKPDATSSPSTRKRTDSVTGASDFLLAASPASLNPEGIPASLDAIKSLLSHAKGSLKIQVYQYNTKASSGGGPWTDLDDALRTAAAKKPAVHVQLLVDNVAMNKGSRELKALAGVPNIEVRTVKIPLWTKGKLDYARLTHSKYLVADDALPSAAAWVGTENWIQSYFTDTRNVGVTFSAADETRKKLIGQLSRIFDSVWKSPYAKPLKATQ